MKAGKIMCVDGRAFQIATVTKEFPNVSKIWLWESIIIKSHVIMVILSMVLFVGNFVVRSWSSKEVSYLEYN